MIFLGIRIGYLGANDREKMKDTKQSFNSRKWDMRKWDKNVRKKVMEPDVVEGAK